MNARGDRGTAGRGRPAATPGRTVGTNRRPEAGDVDLSGKADSGCGKQQTKQHRTGVPMNIRAGKKLVKRCEAGAGDGDRDEAEVVALVRPSSTVSR